MAATRGFWKILITNEMKSVSIWPICELMTARILKSNVRYLTFDLLPSEIENNNINNIHNTLIRLSSVKHFLSICDCVVLGCTHFNVIKNTISKYLKQNNFSGKILDSNSILYKYFNEEKKN